MSSRPQKNLNWIIQADGMVVNGKVYKIAEIARLMVDDNAPLDGSQLSNLMRELKIHYLFRKDIGEKLKDSRNHIVDLTESILIQWKQQTSKDATVPTLIKHLRSCDLNDSAYRLETCFVQNQDPAQPSPKELPIEVQPNPISSIQPDYDAGQSGDPEANNLLDSSQRKEPYRTPQDTAKKKSTKITYTLLLSILAVLFLLVFLVSKISDVDVRYLYGVESPVNFSVPILDITSHNGIGKTIDTKFETVNTMADDPVVGLVKNDTNLTITSPHELNGFFDPANYWKNLQTVEFDNTLGLLCPRNNISNLLMKELSNAKSPLPKLRQLVLNLPSYCEDLVDKILTFFDMNQFVDIEFKGVVNDNNVQQIHEVLHRNSKSLESFHLTGLLQSSINLFEIRNTYVLRSVKTISVKLEQTTETSLDQKVVSDRFCLIFPELSTLETKNISFNLDELLKLQECRKLEYINTVVKVTDNDITHIEEINWMELFPSLKSNNLRLEFDVCPGSAFLERLIKTFELFDNYRFCSNCTLSPKRPQICHMKSKRG